MADPVYEGPEDPVAGEEAEVLDPSTPFIDKTAAGPWVSAPGSETPELADADETLAGAPNAPTPAAPSATPGTVVNPPATPAGRRPRFIPGVPGRDRRASRQGRRGTGA